MHARTSLALAHGKCGAETLAGVFADGQEKSGLVHAIGILGINRQTRKIKRTPAYIERTIDLGPTVARIVGAEQGGVIPGLDHGVHPRRLTGSDADSNPPQI